MSPERLVGLRQPDRRSCGAATVVAARLLLDPGYAETARAGFGPEVLATHRRLTRWPPWPRALGTPPWAVARELTALTGRRHRTRLVRWSTTPTPASGALYVGDRWLPRHVVLVLGERCYEPASGRLAPLDGRPLGGWRVRWFVVA